MRRGLARILAFSALALAAGANGAWAGPADARPALSPFDAAVAQAKKAMMADPMAALGFSRKAEALARTVAPSERKSAVATSLWLESEALTRINKVKEAHGVLNRAIALAANDGMLTKLDGDLALSLARIADNEGNIGLALASYHNAHDIFAKLKEARSEAIAFQGLGGIYDEAHDFDREIQYYRLAQQAYSQDPALELSATNNAAFAHLQLGRYDDAIKGFRRALEISAPMKSPFLDANILTNLAAAYAKQHKFAEAEEATNRAFKLLGPRDQSGGAPFVWGVEAMVDYERGALELAQADLDRAFRGVNLKTTIAPFRDLHEIAYKVYRDRGNTALALAHLEAFKRLDDQGRSLAASANLALMGAQFDFANQRLEIEHLKAVQLQRDSSLRESRAAMQRLILTSLLVAGIVLIGWISFRHMMVSRHRKALGEANVRLTETLKERDIEIERRSETEAQLRVAMDEAAQASRAKHQFLANMSHELRTPLNAIIGFSELMASGATARAQEYATDINAGGRRLLAVLSDILDMARIESGSISLSEQEMPLKHVMEGAIENFAEEATRAGKAILTDGVDPDLWIRCDEDKLRQVVGNLLSNALKFTGVGGRIALSTRKSAQGVDLMVADNGIGIPQDKIAQVLEPFAQAESAYARSTGGVGLGLPIAKSLIALHGGRLTLESSSVGTVATVHLPRERVLLTPRAPLVAIAS